MLGASNSGNARDCKGRQSHARNEGAACSGAAVGISAGSGGTDGGGCSSAGGAAARCSSDIGHRGRAVNSWAADGGTVGDNGAIGRSLELRTPGETVLLSSARSAASDWTVWRTGPLAVGNCTT